MADYKIGDNVHVLVGVFAGKRGEVTTIVPEQAKSVGVFLQVKDSPILTTWFQPHEIEKEN